MPKPKGIVSLRQVCLLMHLVSLAYAYKTVVFVHGLNCGIEGFQNLKDKIINKHPGTNVILLKYYEDLKTLDPLPEQLALVNTELQKIMQENPDGIHLVCHSQGNIKSQKANSNF